MRIQMPLYDAPGAAGGGGSSSIGNIGDGSETARDLAELGDGSEEEGGEEEGGEEEGSEEEGSEEEGSEEESGEEGNEEEEESQEEEGNEEGEEEEGEEETPESSGRPSVKAITEFKDGKYKDLFKDFPDIKRAYFTLPKYQEIFADPEAAQEASEKSDAYDMMETSLMSGDPLVLIRELHGNNPQAMRQVAEKFADTLRTASKDDYIALAMPILEDVVQNAFSHGVKTKDKNLELAARHLANYIWANGGEIPDGKGRRGTKEEHPAEKQLKEERAAHAQEKLQGAITTLEPKLTKALETVTLNKLDGLTKFEQKAIVKDVRAEVDTALETDQAFQTTLKALWKKAADSGYSSASLSRIENHWITRARQIAPAIRNRLKQEAIAARRPGGEGERQAGGKKKKTFFNRGGGNARPSSTVLNPTKIDWKKTSDADILSGDTSRVKLRK